MDTRSVTRRCLASWIPPRLACFTCFRLHIVDDDPIVTPNSNAPKLNTSKLWSFYNPSPRLPSLALRTHSSKLLVELASPKIHRRFLTKIVSKTTNPSSSSSPLANLGKCRRQNLEEERMLLQQHLTKKQKKEKKAANLPDTKVATFTPKNLRAYTQHSCMQFYFTKDLNFNDRRVQ